MQFAHPATNKCKCRFCRVFHTVLVYFGNILFFVVFSYNRFQKPPTTVYHIFFHQLLFYRNNLSLLKCVRKPCWSISLPCGSFITIKAISYSWVSIQTFHKFIAQQVEQRRLGWQDLKSIQDQAMTFFHHSGLRNLRPRKKSPCHSAASPSGNHQQAVPPTVPKACRTWNYTAACECDQQDTTAYKEHHRCRVCKGDHPMLHCSKRCTLIPSQ